MADDHKPQQGDEAELFELYNAAHASAGGVVRTSPEVIEDACSIAWAQFLRHQPDRNREWRAWLFRTAQREALVPRSAASRDEALRGCLRDSSLLDSRTCDERDAFRERDELEAAVDVLAQLPPRLRQIAFLRATDTGTRRSEITGDAKRGCPHWSAGLTSTSTTHFRSSTRRRSRCRRESERLRELESSAPGWLSARSVDPPTARRPRPRNAPLDWRRAALAIDDYRQLAGFDSQTSRARRPPQSRPVRAEPSIPPSGRSTPSSSSGCAREGSATEGTKSSRDWPSRGMASERLRPVMYRGELVALAGRDRFHLLAPWLDERPASDRELQFVALLCLYHRQVFRGALPASADPGVAERWATLALAKID